MTRKVVNRSPHREVGMVNAAWLLDHPVEHESHLEKRFIMVALSCPVVTDIVHQPRTLELELEDGTSVEYTPDFQLTYADGGTAIIEVKPTKFLQKHLPKLNAARKALASEGIPFDVATEKEIDGNSLSARALLLMRYGRMTFTLQEAQECKRLLERYSEGNASVQQLMEHGVSEDLIWNLVATHEFRIPPGLMLSQEERVAINHPHQGGSHDYFRAWAGIA